MIAVIAMIQKGNNISVSKFWEKVVKKFMYYRSKLQKKKKKLTSSLMLIIYWKKLELFLNPYFSDQLWYQRCFFFTIF